VIGNVGVGTTVPTAPLHVVGNILSTGTIIASNVSVIGDFVTLNTVTSNTEQMVITNAGTGPGLKVTQTGAEAIAEFYDDGGVLALKVADGGNVGIGTANPTASLHVVGRILATSEIQISSGGLKFADGFTQTSAADTGQLVGLHAGYLPTTAGSAIQIINNSSYTVSMLRPFNIAAVVSGTYMLTTNTRVIYNTWNTSTANQVSFYMGYFEATNTKVVGIVLTNNANGITAYQSSAYYWNTNVLASSGWTTSGGIPVGSSSQIVGSGGYGVSQFCITR